MYHIFTNHGFSSFFERLPDRLRTDVLGVPQFHQPAAQQTDGPPPPPGGWLAARQCDQVRLLFAIQLARPMPRLGAPAEDRRQALTHEGTAIAVDGCQPDRKGSATLIVKPDRNQTGTGLEQN